MPDIFVYQCRHILRKIKKRICKPTVLIVSANKHVVATRWRPRRQIHILWTARDKIAVGKLAEQPRRILLVPSLLVARTDVDCISSEYIACRTTSAVLCTPANTATRFSPGVYSRPLDERERVPIDFVLSGFPNTKRAVHGTRHDFFFQVDINSSGFQVQYVVVYQENCYAARS